MNNFNFEILNKKLNLTREELYDARDNRRLVNISLTDDNKNKCVLGLILSVNFDMAEVHIIESNVVKTVNISNIYRYKYICIIGSMKFFNSHMIDTARLVQASGSMPLLPFKCPDQLLTPDGTNMNEWRRNQFDLMIIQNIILADEIIVVNPNNYIGDSTMREINFAKTLNKPIIYQYQNNEEFHLPPLKVTLCGSFKFESVFYDLNKYLTMNGILCNIPSTLESGIDMNNLSTDIISNIHNIHMEKIILSDVVIFIDMNDEMSYMGEDTRREEKFVKSINKKHIYLSSLIGLYGKNFYDVLLLTLYELNDKN